MNINFQGNFQLNFQNLISPPSIGSFGAMAGIAGGAAGIAGGLSLGAIGSSFGAAGGLSKLFGALPKPMFMPPRPPMMGLARGLGQALSKLTGLLQGLQQNLGGIGGMGGRVGQGVQMYGGFQAMAGMQGVMGGMATAQQALSVGRLGLGATGSIQGQLNVNFQANLGMDTQFPGLKKTEDPFGKTGMGKKGYKSNLANSPEATLALHNIIKGGKSKPEDIVKELKSKYGIDAEVIQLPKDGDKKAAKAIKFANGDMMVDANGNGGMDMGDYKFKDALKSIKDQYGIDAKDFQPGSPALQGFQSGKNAQSLLSMLGGFSAMGSSMSNSLFASPMFGQDLTMTFAMAFRYSEQQY